MTPASETPVAALEMTEVGPGPFGPVAYRNSATIPKTLAYETPAAALEMSEVGPGPSDPVAYRALPKRPAGQAHPYKSIHIYSEIE